MCASTSRQADRYNIDSLIMFGCCVGDGGGHGRDKNTAAG